MLKSNRSEKVPRETTAVRRPSLSDALSECVLSLIREESLSPGDRLPSVRAMAERFSVAAPTLRETLRRLQTSGVVELRHGSGVYVRNAQERMVFTNSHRNALDVATILDLLDARRLIEPYLAELTARKISDAECAQLSVHLDQAQRYLDGSDDHALHRINMAFHCGIARFSGNSILSQTLESLVELYSAEQRVVLIICDDRCRDYREHRAVLAALSNRDSDQAAELMRAHMQDVTSIVRENGL